MANKNSKTKSKAVYAKSPVFMRVMKYCLPHELLITALPFFIVVISILTASFGAIESAEFISFKIAFPIALLAPLFITVKQIGVLKSSFPRKTDDSHKIILSVFSSTLLCQLILIILFCISCSIYGLFPLNFRPAAYIRDMYMSSPAAMIITYITVFMAYTIVSLMSTTAYFLGERTKNRFSFTISCLIFAGMYVLLLIIFLLAYFSATFVDIKSLEDIQIANSIFNSSMLCSFVTFIFIVIASLPILYWINYKALVKLETPKKKKTDCV